jgi:hypothetical protein
MNLMNVRTGKGKMIVEFFSLEIVLSVCKYLNWIAAGDSAMMSAASLSDLLAFISPSAAITLARASRVACMGDIVVLALISL